MRYPVNPNQYPALIRQLEQDYQRLINRDDVINVGTDYQVQDNSSFDNTGPIQAALDASRDGVTGVVTKPVVIPCTRSGFACNSSLKYYDGSTVFGQGPFLSKIRFTNDTSGFVPFDPTSITSEVYFRGLWLKGSAPTSASATATVGFDSTAVSFSTHRDFFIEDFVNPMKWDASNVGHGENIFDNIALDGAKFPNPTNGYPNYLLWVTGNGNRPQSNHFRGSWYSNITTTTSLQAGDGATVAFDIDLGAGNLLWQESGIKVDLFSAALGRFVRKVITTDYTLKNMDGGGAGVAIAAAATNVRARKIRVTFVVAPPLLAGSVMLRWTDPWAKACIRIDATSGNQNDFEGTLSGAEIGIDDNGGLNRFVCLSSQLLNVAVKARANASQSDYSGVVVLDNSTVDSWYSLDASATGIRVLNGGGRQWKELAKTGGDQNFTGAFARLTFDSTNFLAFTERSGGNREVQFECTVKVSNTGGAQAQGNIKIRRSTDNAGSFTDLVSRQFEINEGGATSSLMTIPVSMTVRDTDDTVTLAPRAGNFAIVYYDVQVNCTAGTQLTVVGSAASPAALRVRNVERL